MSNPDSLVHAISTNLSILGRMYGTPYTPDSLLAAHIQHAQLCRFFESRDCLRILHCALPTHEYTRIDLEIRKYVLFLRSINPRPSYHRGDPDCGDVRLSLIVASSLNYLQEGLCDYLEHAPPTENIMHLV